MKKVLEWLAGGLLKDATGLIDKVVTTDKERAELKNQLTSLVLSQALESDKVRSAIIEAEAKGNWLQRSWRPILMLAFGFIILYSHFIAPAFGLPNTELNSDFWGLLEIGVGGYVIGRSVEKISGNINVKKDK